MDRMDLTVGCVYEVIVSTYGEGGRPHAAPMGMIFKGSREMILRPFKKSRTYINLSSTMCGVADVSADPEIFYKTAFKEANPGGRLPLEWFEPAERVEAPRLRDSYLHIEFSVVRVEDEGEGRARITCGVEGIGGERVLPKPYCRGTYATIECIIHATRIREYLREDRLGEAEDLIHLVNYYRDLAYRVAPTSEYAGIIDDLIASIDSWRKDP
jgi:hypothetical protein